MSIDIKEFEQLLNDETNLGISKSKFLDLIVDSICKDSSGKDVFGIDHNLTVKAFLIRDLVFQQDPKETIAFALKKLKYDGKKIILDWMGKESLDKESTDKYLQKGDISNFYKSLSLNALSYLGW